METQTMDKLLKRYCGALEWALVVLLAVMVALVFGNVVMRYAFNSGITISEEMSRWAFVWLTFLGAIVALRERAHLGSDMLVGRLGPLGKRVCLGLAQLLMLWMTWLMASGAWAQTQINWDVEAPVSGASVAWFYSAGVVFAASTGVILLREFWRTVTGQLSEADLVQVQESEDLAQIDELHLNQSQTFKKH
jgi:TRAP-type C4-dicarboxylate transport system permease small subunit